MVDGIDVQEFDGTPERMALTAIIMSDKALAEMRNNIKVELFQSMTNRPIVEWCLDFYDKYGKAPKYHIKDLYLENIGKLDEATSELINMTLSYTSERYAEMDEFNEEFATDQLVKFLNLAQANNLLNEVGDALDLNNEQGVVDKLGEFKPITRNILEERSLRDMDEDDPEYEDESVLFDYPGVLSDFLGSCCRSSFTAILSPEKRGKTFFLLYFANLAAKKKNRVLFVSAGDMTLREIVDRQKLMFTGISPRMRNSQIIYRPVLDCKRAIDGSCMKIEYDAPVLQIPDRKKLLPEIALNSYPNHEVCTECRNKNTKDFQPDIWWEEVEIHPLGHDKHKELFHERLTQFEKICGKKGTGNYIFFPTKTASPEDIEVILKRAVERNEPYDVVIVDYMDILAAPRRARRMDERNQINATWEEMRRISQTYNIGLITATQGKRDMYNDDADQGSTSEDKRKAAHVTCMFALNQKPYEKEQGIIRVSPLFRRDGNCSLTQEVTVLTCFGLGKVYLGSFASYKQFGSKSERSSFKKERS